MQYKNPRIFLFLVLVLGLTLFSFSGVYAKPIEGIESGKVLNASIYQKFIVSDSSFDSITVLKKRGHIKTNYSDWIHDKSREVKYSVQELRDGGIIYPAVYVNGSLYSGWSHDWEWLYINFKCCSDIIIEINNTGFISIVESFSTEGIQGDNQTAIPNFNLQGPNGNLTIIGKSNLTGVNQTNLTKMNAYFNMTEGTGENWTNSTVSGLVGNLTNMNMTGNETSGWSTDCPPGLTGSCLKFSNAEESYVWIGDESVFDLTNGSFSAWVNLSSGSDDDHEIFSKHFVRFIVDVTTGKMSFSYRHGADVFATAESTGGISYDVWTHLAWVWNSTTVRYYIDGDLDSEDALTAPVTISASKEAIIGAVNTKNDNFVNGSLAEIIVWNDTLTSDRIWDLAHINTLNTTVNSSGGELTFNTSLRGIRTRSGTPAETFSFIEIDTNISQVLNRTWNISSSGGSGLVNWSYSNVYNLTFIEVTRWDDVDGDGLIDDVEYNYTVCENSSAPCTINGSVTHRLLNASLEPGFWKSFSDGERIGTPRSSGGLLTINDPPVNTIIRATKPQESLWFLIELIQELPGLMDAIADLAIPLAKLILIFAIIAMVIKIFMQVVEMMNVKELMKGSP